jgi:drug/metabolite transporter (DMT)-like permease
MSDFGARGLSTDLTQALKCVLLAAGYCAWAGVDLLRAAGAAGAGGAGAGGLAAAAAALWPGAACAAAWAALTYSAVIPGALADVLQARGQARVPAAEAQVLLAAEPLWTALLGAALLGERMSTTGWAGAALVVAALGIASGPAAELAAWAAAALRRARRGGGGADDAQR